MLKAINNMRERKEAGFTLPEILMTLLIIGILMAIAVPIYMNQQEKAEQNAVQSDISNTLTAMSMQKLDGKFTPNPPTDVVYTDGVNVEIHTAADGLSTCVDGYHDSTPSQVWSISSVDKVVKEQACS